MKKVFWFLLAMNIVVSIQVNAQVDASETKTPDSINQTDSKGEKFGYWIEKTGDITYRGEYYLSNKNKSWVGYYPTNRLYKIEYYDNGVKDGISIQFDKKGKISVIEHFKNGLLHGQTIYYSQFNDTPASETEYTFGKKNGVYRQFYENGKIQEETWFKDDLKNGLSLWNNKNGQLIAEYNYKAGNFDGAQKTFYAKDTLQSVENYLDGKLSGDFTEYHRNGKIKISGKYLNGEKDGPWTEYDESGKIILVTRFKNGVDVKKK
jgi:antitoxin component YwqK of YwqJK toxin-antitoxin module